MESKEKAYSWLSISLSTKDDQDIIQYFKDKTKNKTAIVKEALREYINKREA